MRVGSPLGGQVMRGFARLGAGTVDEVQETILELRLTWWLIPLSKWVITPVINGISIPVEINRGYLEQPFYTVEWEMPVVWLFFNQKTVFLL